MNKKAIYIPYSSANRLFFFIFFAVLVISPLNAAASSETRIFYVRLDVKYTNNAIERSHLLMVPAENDFRAEKFSPVVVSGTADISQSRGKGDIKTRATHNAIKRLLEGRGLKSVKSRTATVNSTASGQTVMSYEGAVKLPCRTMDLELNQKTGQCRIKISIAFSATAFPDKWPALQVRQRIKQVILNFFSLFQ